ncbi:unnamed protein product [Symbiodinium sp. CCMP2592]|nr:unnamed protein product [Symbiodinium sp. CCMP2592]
MTASASELRGSCASAQVVLNLTYSTKFQRVEEQHWAYACIIGVCLALFVLEVIRGAVTTVVELRKFEIRRRLVGGDFLQSRIRKNDVGLKMRKPPAKKPALPLAPPRNPPKNAPPPPPPGPQTTLVMFNPQTSKTQAQQKPSFHVLASGPGAKTRLMNRQSLRLPAKVGKASGGATGVSHSAFWGLRSKSVFSSHAQDVLQKCAVALKQTVEPATRPQVLHQGHACKRPPSKPREAQNPQSEVSSEGIATGVGRSQRPGSDGTKLKVLGSRCMGLRGFTRKSSRRRLDFRELDDPFHTRKFSDVLPPTLRAVVRDCEWNRYRRTRDLNCTELVGCSSGASGIPTFRTVQGLSPCSSC